MPYMHKKTFEITQSSGDGSKIPQEYFEIDDLIAPSVQILNRKGYITAGCCSGHWYTRGISESYVMFEEGVSLQGLPELPDGFEVYYPFREILERIPDPTPELRAKLGNKHWRIIKKYSSVSDVSDIGESMKRLHEWTLDLNPWKR